VVPNSTPPCFVNSQQVSLLPVGIQNKISVLFVIFVSSFQWHACELAELSACRAKCMTTINTIYIYKANLRYLQIS